MVSYMDILMYINHCITVGLLSTVIYLLCGEKYDELKKNEDLKEIEIMEYEKEKPKKKKRKVNELYYWKNEYYEMIDGEMVLYTNGIDSWLK